MRLEQEGRGLTVEVPPSLLDQWARYFTECFDVDVRPGIDETIQALKHAVINILAFAGLEGEAERVEEQLVEIRLLL